MEPILLRYFNNFKNTYEIYTGQSDNEDENNKKDSSAFEKFINYVIFSVDYPGVFTSDTDLLDFVSVGGQYDTGIDGIGIKVNGKLVRNTDEVLQIVERSKKIDIEFVFIQSKKQTKFDASELNTFGVGVGNFFSESNLPENDKITSLRKIKDFIYSSEKVIEKLEENPSLFVYYVALGSVPEDEHFSGTIKLIEKNLSASTCYFNRIKVDLIGGKDVISSCRELDNKYSKQINIIDIFPLIVETKDEKVKKAYAFTCKATELLKLLTKEDGALRRALFNDNVRDYLEKSTVNKEIEKTITDNPEFFLLCNNGITIVCSDFEQVRDKLVKIENPQIVNGCQTSNSIYKHRQHANIDKIQVLVRLISTEDVEVSNAIVRGTNKQNMVLDEAFESTLPFHRDTLEPFFQSIDNDVKIFYERRIRQYSNDPLIKKTQIVNLRILTKSFVGMFLEAPYMSSKHEAKLLEEYAGKSKRKIFLETHSPYPYYISALTWYMFEKYFRENKLDEKYRPYTEHLYLIYKYSIGEIQRSFVDDRKTKHYFQKLLTSLKEPQFSKNIENVVLVFEKTRSSWQDRGKSMHGIKDVKEFSELLVNECKSFFVPNKNIVINEEIERDRFDGTIINKTINKHGNWIGFIKSEFMENNVYFDSRGFDGKIQELSINQAVSFEVSDNYGKNMAVKIELAMQ